MHASAVNTSDWRIRAAAFPGFRRSPARVIFGLCRPRNQRLGSEFADVGEVVGNDVKSFVLGLRVFGISSKGGVAGEYVAIAEGDAVTEIPEGLSFIEAAAYLSESSPRWCSLNNSHLSARISTS